MHGFNFSTVSVEYYSSAYAADEWGCPVWAVEARDARGEIFAWGEFLVEDAARDAAEQIQGAHDCLIRNARIRCYDGFWQAAIDCCQIGSCDSI